MEGASDKNLPIRTMPHVAWGQRACLLPCFNLEAISSKSGARERERESAPLGAAFPREGHVLWKEGRKRERAGGLAPVPREL